MPKVIYIILACIFLALAMVGAVLPVMPTVPFLLLAAWCASRGSSRLHKWMYSHPRFGKQLRDWEREKAISKQSKIVAVITICGSWLLIYFSVENQTIKVVVGLILLAVVLYLITRPEPQE